MGDLGAASECCCTAHLSTLHLDQNQNIICISLLIFLSALAVAQSAKKWPEFHVDKVVLLRQEQTKMVVMAAAALPSGIQHKVK